MGPLLQTKISYITIEIMGRINIDTSSYEDEM